MELVKDVKMLRDKIEETKSETVSRESENAVLSGIMKAQNSGRLSGVHGRLGDLGTIDMKYDVAVTTAVGALNHIVVENVDCGQKCLEFLR